MFFFDFLISLPGRVEAVDSAQWTVGSEGGEPVTFGRGAEEKIKKSYFGNKFSALLRLWGMAPAKTLSANDLFAES